MPPARRLFVAALCLCALAAGQPAGAEPFRSAEDADPFEGINRGIYRFNDTLDTWILRPVARGYEKVIPAFARTGVRNFFDNLNTPVDIVNSLLQGKPRRGLSEAARMGLNTTVGFFGLLDPATAAGLANYDEDFGQTMGAWGVPAGPYAVVPFFGPRTIRHGAGQLVDVQYNPQLNAVSGGLRTKINVLWIIQQRAALLAFDDALKDAFDEYALVRDAYLQNRRFQFYDGDPPEEALPFDDDFDEFEAFESAQDAAP